MFVRAAHIHREFWCDRTLFDLVCALPLSPSFPLFSSLFSLDSSASSPPCVSSHFSSFSLLSLSSQPWLKGVRWFRGTARVRYEMSLEAAKNAWATAKKKMQVCAHTPKTLATS